MPAPRSTDMGVAKPDFLRCVGADQSLIENAERFARIDLESSDFEKERTLCLVTLSPLQVCLKMVVTIFYINICCFITTFCIVFLAAYLYHFTKRHHISFTTCCRVLAILVYPRWPSSCEVPPLD